MKLILEIFIILCFVEVILGLENYHKQAKNKKTTKMYKKDKMC